MPDPISWYALGRTIGDAQSISEAIDVALLNHNLDPSAHSQSNEAIDNHRAAETLDHVIGSIHNEHIQDQNKVYDSIVDASGNADFTDIQDAIDHVSAHGGGTIYVRSGSYDIHEGLTLYSHVKIIGEDNQASILHGVGDDLWVLIQGVEGAEITDVLIKNLCFTDIKVDDPLILMGYANDIRLEDNRFTFPNGEDWWPNVCIGSSGPLSKIYITRNHFEDFYIGIYLPAASKIWIVDNYFGEYEGVSINLYNMYDCNIFNNYFAPNYEDNLTDAVIFVESGATNIRIINNIFSGGWCTHLGLGDIQGGIIANNQFLGNDDSYDAIQLSVANYTIVANNFIKDMVGNGIFIYYDDNRCVINGNTIYSNAGYGIRIDNSNCDKNILTSNVCYSNTGGNISDAGTGTVNANNVIT